MDFGQIHAWLERARETHRFRTEAIPFAELARWRFHPATGNLEHESGRFFTIDGLKVETNFGTVPHWSQPIINQPEIGILGILAQRRRGILHFLMQAKMEPGNIRTVQVAPTLQATRSNYMRVHQGRAPAYLEYFRGERPRRALVDILQSEQGARFLRKRNRNVVVEVPEGEVVPIGADFAWLTLGQIQRLLLEDNVVNMDARTVLSCISYAQAPDVGGDCHGDDEVVSWFTEMKCRWELNVERIPLNQVADWVRTPMEIRHREGRFFTVMAVRVEAENREVGAWTQPIVRPHEPGIVAFLARPIRGQLHLLVQAKVEAGNFDVVEMAPTVQCLTGSYRTSTCPPPFLHEVLAAPPERILFDAMQSEEGGRFFREENRSLIVWAGDDLPARMPDNYLWVSLRQLKNLIRYNNFLNVQCRCLLGCLPVEQARA